MASKIKSISTATPHLQFVQDNPRRCNLKEVKNSLRISFEGIKTIDQAVEVLEEMAGETVGA